jgi:hypothetical protein
MELTVKQSSQRSRDQLRHGSQTTVASENADLLVTPSFLIARESFVCVACKLILYILYNDLRHTPMLAIVLC